MDQSSPPPWRDCDPSAYQALYPEFHLPLQFRLLKVKSGYEKHPISCELTTASLSSPPVFHAISYAWGARKFDHQIKLHDCTIWTTRSVSQALKRVRGKWQSKLIWIDALCINQKDTAERSHQVRQMKQIFEAAKRVLVYLGIDHLPAATLPNALKQMIDCFKAFRWRTHWNHPNTDSIQLKGIPPADDGVWVAFRGALCQQWWQRVWIIQEAVVSRDLTFLIGDADVPFDMLLQAYDACLTLGMPLFQARYFTPERQDQILHAGQILHAVDQRGAGRKFFAAADLIEILDAFRDLQASDPRDHCYALLGLSREHELPTLLPDYGKNAQLMLTQYAAYMVERGHGHKVFWSNYSPVLDGSLPS
jgi:Heterokaryon incompatibility protein (HET)